MSASLEEANLSPLIESYRVVLYCELDEADLDATQTAKIYVDNVKFITF